jgi:acyl carrier protein
MGDPSVHESVRQIFEDILNIRIEPDSELLRHSCDQWDSLSHMELMFAIEGEFGIQFSDEALRSLSSLADVVEQVRTQSGS